MPGCITRPYPPCIYNRIIKEYYTRLNFYITFPFFISILPLNKEIVLSCFKSAMIHPPVFKFNESHVNIASCCHNIHPQTGFLESLLFHLKKNGRLEQDISTLLLIRGSTTICIVVIYFHFISNVKSNIMKVNSILLFREN